MKPPTISLCVYTLLKIRQNRPSSGGSKNKVILALLKDEYLFVLVSLLYYMPWRILLISWSLDWSFINITHICTPLLFLKYLEMKYRLNNLRKIMIGEVTGYYLCWWYSIYLRTDFNVLKIIWGNFSEINENHPLI